MTDDRPRYKLIRGRGDTAQENQINESAAIGYKATLITFDPDGRENNQQVIVVMERET